MFRNFSFSHRALAKLIMLNEISKGCFRKNGFLLLASNPDTKETFFTILGEEKRKNQTLTIIKMKATYLKNLEINFNVVGSWLKFFNPGSVVRIREKHKHSSSIKADIKKLNEILDKYFGKSSCILICKLPKISKNLFVEHVNVHNIEKKKLTCGNSETKCKISLKILD